MFDQSVGKLQQLIKTTHIQRMQLMKSAGEDFSMR